MSKTWNYHKDIRKRPPAPQKTVDRLREAEAQEDIREALQASQEATHAS